MRALISLYHQADQFITPANLDRVIDRKFVEEPLMHIAVGSDVDESYRDLEKRVKDRRALPKTRHLRSGDLDPPFRSKRADDVWSERMGYRDRQVIQALYGVLDKNKPGWEVLEESAEEIKAEIQSDRERGAEHF